MAWTAADVKGRTASSGTSSRWAGELVKENHIPVDRLTNCSMCHR